MTVPVTSRPARPRRAAAEPAVVAAPRPRLRIVPKPRRRAPRAPFILLVIGMLAGALLGVLLLNTQRAQNAFSLTAVQKKNAQLRDQVQALRGLVQQDQTPNALANRAIALGMVPGGDPIFVDENGKVLGVGATQTIAPGSGVRVGDLLVVGTARPVKRTTPDLTSPDLTAGTTAADATTIDATTPAAGTAGSATGTATGAAGPGTTATG